MDGLDLILADWRQCRPRGAVLPLEALRHLNLTSETHSELSASVDELEGAEVIHFLRFWRIFDPSNLRMALHHEVAPLHPELRAFRDALLARIDRKGHVSSHFLVEALQRAQRKSADGAAWRPLVEVVSSVAESVGWWQTSIKFALDEVSTMLLPWLQELVEDYCRGSRSAKIFCVKDVAGCCCREACLYLGQNEWDVEGALKCFYEAPKMDAKKAAWSSRGAKLKRNEKECPICVDSYSGSNQAIMTKCCFQVFCAKCHERLTDSTGRLSCPFCRGSDGLARDPDSPRPAVASGRFRRWLGACGQCAPPLRQLAPTCLLCVAVAAGNMCLT